MEELAAKRKQDAKEAAAVRRNQPMSEAALLESPGKKRKRGE